MDTIRVQDKYDMVEFRGVQLADVSTETPSSVRWTEISIYRTEAGRYIIHRVGRSVLYHDHDSTCNTGVPVAVGDLVNLEDVEVDDLMPCPRCRPGDLDWLDPETVILRELDKHSVDVCDAGQVYDRLLLHRAGGETFMSNPAQRAYDTALAADPALLKRDVRRIG